MLLGQGKGNIGKQKAVHCETSDSKDALRLSSPTSVGKNVKINVRKMELDKIILISLRHHKTKNVKCLEAK
jgi:hypothetical protein